MFTLRYMTMLPIAAVSWGDVPTWTAAAVSSGALIFAGLAARSTSRTLRLELDRDEEREQAGKREQASRVVPFPGRIVTSVRAPIEWVDFEVPAVIIRNASDLPIYDVVLDTPRHQPSPLGDLPPSRVLDGGFYYLGIAPPGDTPIELDYDDVADALVSDELIRHVKGGVAVDDSGEEIDAILVEWEARGRPSITFRDANNRLWTRHPNGLLDTGEPAHPPAQVETHE